MFSADVFVIRDYLLLMICYGQVWMILLPQVDEKLELLTEVDSKKKIAKMRVREEDKWCNCHMMNF